MQPSVEVAAGGASGRVLLATHLRPGSELQWGTLASPQPLSNSVARVRRLHLKDVNHEFRLDTVADDVERAARMEPGPVCVGPLPT